MQYIWYTFTALYLIALAFVSGTLTAHMMNGRTAHVGSGDVLLALVDWVGLLGVGALAWFGRKWWRSRQASALAFHLTDQQNLVTHTVSVRAATESAATSHEPAIDRGRAVASVAASPIESLLNDFVDKPIAAPTSPAPVEANSIFQKTSQPDSATVMSPATQFARIADAGDGVIANTRVWEAADSRTEKTVYEGAGQAPETAGVTVPLETTSSMSVDVTPAPVVGLRVADAEPPALEPPAIEPRAMEPLAVEQPALEPLAALPSPALAPPPLVPFPSRTERPAAAQAVPAGPPKNAPLSRQNDQRPRTVRKGYLFAPKIIWGNARSYLIRGWLIAGVTAVVSAVMLVLLRERMSIPQLLILGAIVAAVTLGPLAQTLVATAASRRLGRTWVHLGTSPAAPESEVSGTIWVSNQRLRKAVRERQLIRPAAVRLQCVRGPVSRAIGRLDEREVWHHEVAVRADRMTFMTGRLGIPFRFDLPETVDRVAPGEQVTLAWILSVETTMNGLELAEQFVLPLDPPDPATRDVPLEPPDAQRLDRTPPLRRAR